MIMLNAALYSKECVQRRIQHDHKRVTVAVAAGVAGAALLGTNGRGILVGQ